MKNLNVLIVDDEQVILDFLTRLLHLEGAEVMTATSGQKAIEAAGKERFDIVFLDARMPGIDGLATLRQLKKILPGAKFVMMTGYSVDELLQKAEGEEHIDAFITKPFDMAEIVSILEDYKARQSETRAVEVLIVETENEVSGFFRNLIKDCKVWTVKTGTEALSLLHELKFDLVVTDASLSDMSGADLYAKIKQHHPDLQVILVSANPARNQGGISQSLRQQIGNFFN